MDYDILLHRYGAALPLGTSKIICDNNDMVTTPSITEDSERQLQARLKKWAEQEATRDTLRGRLRAVFCTCAGAAAGHLGCVLNIGLTGLASLGGASIYMIPVLYSSGMALPVAAGALSWWLIEKKSPSQSPKERRNRKWAAVVGTAAALGVSAVVNHHNYVEEYAYLAVQTPEDQQKIRDLAAGVKLSPTEYIREIGLCKTGSIWSRVKDAWNNDRMAPK